MIKSIRVFHINIKKVQKFFESKLYKLVQRNPAYQRQMKKQYFKHLPKFKKQAIQSHKSFDQPIRDTFERIKTSFNLLDCVKLENLLQTQKQVRPLDDEVKKEIFKFFLDKEFDDFSFLKSRSKVSTRILKLTKVKLEETSFDWLSIWNRILLQFPQIARKENYQLQQFLKVIKIFFDQNNAVDVFNYFIRRHGDHSEYVFTYILIFANITANTKEEIFQQFLQELVESYMRAQIKPKTLLIYFINMMKKRKHADISPEKYKMLQNIIMSSILTPPTKDAKSSVESKFTKENAIMVSQFIGKNNPYSTQTIKVLFQIAEKFIFPFQNSTKAVRFLYNLIRFIWKRTEKERRAKVRLQKLIQKEKKLQIQALAQAQAQAIRQKVGQNEQTAQQHPHSDQQVHVQDQDQLNQDQEQIESDQQKEKQQALDQELNNAQEQMLSNQIQQKKNRCYKILKNQITPQIIQSVKQGVGRLFNYVYFVNSKKTVQQFLRYSFIMLPQLIIKSLDLLDKASQIPYINEQGLVMNIQITVQYMFSCPTLLKESLNNLQRILDRILNCSKIIDVWPIYQLLVAKLPLMDQKDLEKIPDQDKDLFQKKYQMNHDRFYQYYSGNVYSAFKRMIREGEFFDQQTLRDNSTCFEELLLNSYPYFKKTLLSQVLEEITENSKNQFVYNFFNSHMLISPQNQQIIDDQINLIKENQSDENLQLKNNLVMLLCYNKPLEQLKKYIRQFATKNSFRVISMYHDIRAQFQLTTEPVDTALKYFEENPKIKFRTSKTLVSRLNAIEEISQYRDQLLNQLYKTVMNPTSLSKIYTNEVQSHTQKSIEQIVKYACGLYRGKTESTTKISLETVGTRKKIIELLKLIHSIQNVLKHKVIDYDNETMKFKSVFPITKKRSLIQNKKLMEIVHALISDDTYLHDVKLTGVLSELLTHQLVFNYGNEVRECKSCISRNSLSNAYEQLPDHWNRYLAMDTFKEKMMLLHFANLLNLVKKDRASWLSEQKIPEQSESNREFFDKVLNEIKILILAPGNEKSISLIKAVLIITGLNGVNEFILNLFKQTNIESRFYWQKVNEIFEQFKNYGVKFSVQQIVELIDNHGKIFMLKDNKKVKQIAMESFKYVITLIKEEENNAKQTAEVSNIERIEKILRKHIDHERFKLFWILSVNFVLGSRKFTSFQDDHLKVKVAKIEIVWNFMLMLEPMIMSETRIVRRLALFIYSLCFRKIKKIVKVSQWRKVQNLQYTPKSIGDFLQSGYLRDNHISQEDKKQTSEIKVESLKYNDNLMKISPYEEYEVSVIDKQNDLYQVYKKIEKQAFQFILKDEDLSLKFITSFHADMVSTAEQLLSMANSSQKQTELSQLIVKQLEETFYYFVPKKLNFDKVEVYFGQRFFKYLMMKDSKNNFGFLFNPKTQDLLKKAILNLESLDNQALILIISQDIIYAYQREYQNLDMQIKQKIENFILNVYNQMAKKSSGSIFKKWVFIFKKIENQKALQFILSNSNKQIFKEKRRVCRNAYVYLSIKLNDFNEHVNVLKVLLENKIELENSIVNKIINSILTHPEKYPIDKNLAQKYKFIDFEKEVNAGTIEKSTERTYIIRNAEFKEYLLEVLKRYVRTPTQNQKQSEFIKNAYGLILNAINCFCHSFQSEQNVEKISQLLDLIYEMSLNKEQTQVVDYEQAEPYLKTIFSYQFQDVANFEKILKSVMKLIKALSSKRQVSMLTIILHRPYNFTMLEQEKYEEVLYEIFTLQQTNNNYKELMTNLSVIMSFRMPPIEKFIDLIARKCEVTGLEGKTQQQKVKILIKNKKTKGKILLLFQCEQLALVKLQKDATSFILNESTKERKNIWCRQMLALRGKKEYLDDVDTYHVWQGIKANSNPYNYIV